MATPGFIYVLKNKSLPNMYKVGYTTRSVEARINELSKASGVPTRFTEAYSLHFNNVRLAEKKIHEILSIDEDARVAENREFFSNDLPTIIKTIDFVKELEDGDELEEYFVKSTYKKPNNQPNKAADGCLKVGIVAGLTLVLIFYILTIIHSV